MSERILKALMQLFAIVANVGRDDSNAREFVRLFLDEQLNKELVNEYLAVYDQYYEEQNKKREGLKARKRTSLNSVKVLKICMEINKELTQKQKIYVLIQLLEFIYQNDNDTDQALEFVDTVSDSFNISQKEYILIRDFVRSAVDKIEKNEFILLINKQERREGEHHHIKAEGLDGQARVLYIDSVNMLFMKYFGKTELQLKIFNESESNLGLVYGAYLEVDVNLNKVTSIPPKIKDNVYSILGLNHIGPPSMIMCTKLAIKKIGGFDELLRHREDIDFYFRLSEHYNVSYTDEVIIKYYVHSGALSEDYKSRLLYMLRYINKHYPKIKEPKLRWSELQERLGELNAVNKNRKKAFSAFVLAYVNRPLRLVILIKIGLLIFGKTKF